MEQVRPARNRATRQVRTDPQSVGIGNSGHACDPLCRIALGCFLAIRSGGIEDHCWRDALLRRLAAVGVLSSREQWKRLVPVLDLGKRNRLQYVTANQVAHIDETDVGAVDGA